MSDKWTPGPWRTEGPDMFGDYNILHSADALAVAAVVESAYPADPRVVVGVPSNLRSTDEITANACLISAAPDMAEALHNLIALASPFMTDAPQQLGLSQARAALAKARGLA